MKDKCFIRTAFLLLILLVGSVNGWGQSKVSTLNFTAKCNGSGTADDGVTWTVISDGTESKFSESKGIHYGTDNAKVTYIKLSTSDIPGTITKVVVNASTASGVSAKVSVMVGGATFGSAAKSLSSSAKDYTFEGSASGEIVVTVTKPKNATQALYVKSITVYYYNPLAITAISLDKTSTTLRAGTTETLTATVTPENATDAVVWSSSNENVATVTNGVVTAVAAGTTTITAASPSDATIKAECKVTVLAPVAVTGVTLDKSAMTLLVGRTETLTATVAPEDATNKDIVWTSSDESVATVENGVVTAVAKGTADITVTTADGNHQATCKVKVNPAAINPEGADLGGKYVRVTDASTLKDGDKVVIVCEEAGKIMAEDKGNNRAAADVTIEEHTIVDLPSAAEVITLVKDNSKEWRFKVNEGYLYAASNSENYLKTKSSSDPQNNSNATITFDAEGNAIIQFQGDNTHNTIRYYSSNKLFSCYQYGQKAIQLYRYEPDTSFDISIGATGYRTIVTAKAVTVPEGVEAYVVTENNDKDVILAQVKTLMAGEPYILKGAEGIHTLTVAEQAEQPSTNKLQISDEKTGTGVFVLANKSKGVGFYRWVGGPLGAGRVYLPAVTSSNAIGYLGFSDDATDIHSIDNGQLTIDNVYDLSGRRVAQPSKGLYIINGKKVVLK